MAAKIRGDEVGFTVTGWSHHGVLVEANGGERGWVEGDSVSEGPYRPEEWPPVGTRLRGLVLGYTHEGRIRVCLRAVDGRPSPDRWPRP